MTSFFVCDSPGIGPHIRQDKSTNLLLPSLLAILDLLLPALPLRPPRLFSDP